MYSLYTPFILRDATEMVKEHLKCFQFIYLRMQSDCNYFLPVECVVLILRSIAELVADTMGRADGLVNVSMGMAVYPIVDTTVFNVVGKFYGEGSVNLAAAEFWRHQLKGRHIVGDNNLVLGSTFCY